MKVSPLIRSFNSGETSILLEGRTDIDRYPSTNRQMFNYIAAPQGPAIGRSGTYFMGEVYKNAEKSTLVPFVFDDDVDFIMIEFANLRCRFWLEDGLLTYAPVAGTVTSAAPFKIDSAALGANVGDEVAFGGFAANYNLNAVVGKITAKVGTVYTFDTVFPALLAIPGAPITVARVYHVVSPYTSAQAATLKATQSLDILYLTTTGVKPYKLARSDTYSWAFTAITFIDGPYLDPNETDTTFTLSATGKATVDMTANNAPAGWVVTGTGPLAAANTFYKAFNDPSVKDWYDSGANQAGFLQIQAPVAFVCDGYSMSIPTDNTNATYSAKDYGPSDWTLSGSNDGVTYTVIDEQTDYVLWNSHKSVFFEIPNTTAYLYYKLEVRSLVRNGTQNFRLANLTLRSTASAAGITITASSVTGINNGQGFLATDVGRLVRIKGGDGSWRPLVITARASATQVTATLLGEPFRDLNPSSNWRLGYWSDTTGYPHYSYFYQDRLWFAGSDDFPDLLVASVTGKYENMAQSDSQDVVLDTSAIVNRLNSRRLARIRWMAGSKDGLLLGTGSQEYIVKSSDVAGKTITPGNAKAEEMSSRGSAAVEPIPIDGQVLYVQRGARTMRELAYSYEADGYKSPSMSTLASHIGIVPFEQLAYAAEPHSIVWARRSDGTVVGLTYNRDENVIGWHRHGFPTDYVKVGGLPPAEGAEVDDYGVVESIAVMPSSDQLQDVLWLIINRTINGATKRYVEKLTRFWDFDMTLDDAHFVDCAIRYAGDGTTSTIYGLQHLEGLYLYGLADGEPFGPKIVQGGALNVGHNFTNVIVGIGYDGLGETSRLEAGAQDGTAQGKTKRIHALQAIVWASHYGELGVKNEDTGEVEWTPLEYDPQDAEQLETTYLVDGILKPVTAAPGYERSGSVFYRRKKEKPVPFNLVAIMPKLDTQDAA